MAAKSNARKPGKPKAAPGATTFEHRRISLADIIVDPEVQAREVGNTTALLMIEETAERYKAAMMAGAVFPPITVFEGQDGIVLADGFTRYEAASRLRRLLSHVDIDCEVRPGTKRDAVLFAVGANDTHGLQRTNADKRKAVDRLLRDPEWGRWSDNEIAKLCLVSQPFVSARRAELVASNVIGEPGEKKRTYTRRGKIATMKTGRIGKRKQPARRTAPEPQPQPDPQPKRQPEPDQEPAADQAKQVERDMDAAEERARQAENNFAAMQTRFFEANAENTALRAQMAAQAGGNARPVEPATASEPAPDYPLDSRELADTIVDLVMTSGLTMPDALAVIDAARALVIAHYNGDDDDEPDPTEPPAPSPPGNGQSSAPTAPDEFPALPADLDRRATEPPKPKKRRPKRTKPSADPAPTPEHAGATD